MDQRIREKIDTIKGVKANVQVLERKCGDLEEEVIKSALEIFKALGYTPDKAINAIRCSQINNMWRSTT